MTYTQSNHQKYGGVHQKRSHVKADSGKLFANDGDTKFYMAFASGHDTMLSGSSSVTVWGSADLEISTNSHIVITPTTSGAAGTWHVEKTDPVRKWDPVSRAIKTTTFGYFTVYSSLVQTADIDFDYAIANSSIMEVAPVGVDPDYSSSAGVAFHRNTGETGPDEEFVNDTSFKGVGHVNTGETGPDEEFFYEDPSTK